MGRCVSKVIACLGCCYSFDCITSSECWFCLCPASGSFLNCYFDWFLWCFNLVKFDVGFDQISGKGNVFFSSFLFWSIFCFAIRRGCKWEVSIANRVLVFVDAVEEQL